MMNGRLSRSVLSNTIARRRASHLSHRIVRTRYDNSFCHGTPLPAGGFGGSGDIWKGGDWTFGSAQWRASFPRYESTAADRARQDVEYKELREAPRNSGLEPREEEGEKGIAEPPEHDIEPSKENRLVYSSYWGIGPRKMTREDGSVWPWNCFRPWETYTPSVDIDLSKHHVPKTFVDKFAYWTVKFLRVPTDIFFQRRYGCRAMMLETVAAVPGMVGGMLLHCKSLRKFEHSGGWIKALLEEAENERMHLMTMVEIVQPKWYERALVLAVQGVFFNAFFLLYVISPKLAHRIVGYLEEEAIHSYTEFLKELDNGNIQNLPAPLIAIDYWRLPKDANLRDVVVVIRADEAHHRDVNHFASDIHFQGKQLRDAPAPIGYH